MPRQNARSAKLSGILTVGALSFGVMIATLGPGMSRAATTATAAEPATAHTARTFSLSETGSLHLTSKHGFTLNEQGSASGTISGAIYVHLNIVSTSRVTAEVSIYPSGGSITGEGTARYARGSQTAHFSGSMTIARGTGGYAHAHGSGLSFSGTIQRSNDAITVHVGGSVSD
jgi:hypothetical protein